MYVCGGWEILEFESAIAKCMFVAGGKSWSSSLPSLNRCLQLEQCQTYLTAVPTDFLVFLSMQFTDFSFLRKPFVDQINITTWDVLAGYMPNVSVTIR